MTNKASDGRNFFVYRSKELQRTSGVASVPNLPALATEPSSPQKKEVNKEPHKATDAERGADDAVL